MRYSVLGTSGLKVSRVCLGTMTWGEQNTEEDAHEQIAYALDQGVNFMDTAELYAVPTSKGTYGRTEEIIGSWFAKHGKRDQVILASKVCPGIPWIRGGAPLSAQAVTDALDHSLSRLQTDYLDLYQLHWPNRPFPHFGQNHAGILDFAKEDTAQIEDNLLDILRALGDAVTSGKVRHVGLSDDSAWGIMKYIALSKEHDLPRMVSIQNEFSLLNRSDDPYVAEVCVREDVAYMPWSPLACGQLSGKYANGNIPEGTRWATQVKVQDHFDSFRDNAQAHSAVAAYIEVAKKHGLDVCQMALKFVDSQNFVTSTIIGATKMEQLKSNIAAFDLTLTDDVFADIDRVYRQYPIPY